eukprot:5444184-Pyramimonas_sp.AAC.1
MGPAVCDRPHPHVHRMDSATEADTVAADSQRLADELEAAPTFPSQERQAGSGRSGKGGAT